MVSLEKTSLAALAADYRAKTDKACRAYWKLPNQTSRADVMGAIRAAEAEAAHATAARKRLLDAALSAGHGVTSLPIDYGDARGVGAYPAAF